MLLHKDSPEATLTFSPRLPFSPCRGSREGGGHGPAGAQGRAPDPPRPEGHSGGGARTFIPWYPTGPRSPGLPWKRGEVRHPCREHQAPPAGLTPHSLSGLMVHAAGAQQPPSFWKFLQSIPQPQASHSHPWHSQGLRLLPSLLGGLACLVLPGGQAQRVRSWESPQRPCPVPATTQPQGPFPEAQACPPGKQVVQQDAHRAGARLRGYGQASLWPGSSRAPETLAGRRLPGCERWPLTELRFT